MPDDAAAAARSVLIVEERAHLSFGHYPVRFAQLAEGYAELGYRVEVLTSLGWARDQEVPDPHFVVRRFGALAWQSKRVAARLRRSDKVAVRRAGTVLAMLATTGAARARRRLMSPAPELVVVLAFNVDPVLFAIASGPGRWLLNQFGPPEHLRERTSNRVLTSTVPLARRAERRRRDHGGCIRLSAADDAWTAQWERWAPFLHPTTLPIAGARPFDRVEDARSRLGLPAVGRVALLFGADHSKDPDTVLEAFRRLDGWILVIAGEVGDSVDVPRGEGVHVRAGHVSDEERDLLLSAADLMVFSFVRDYRPNSGTLMDAISVGVPVVCSAGSAAAEIVRRHRLGALFAPGDPASLARAVRDVPPSIAPDDLARARAEHSNLAVARNQLRALGCEPPGAEARGG